MRESCQAFEAGLLFCWSHWHGNHSSNIWNLILSCLMWTVWTKRNCCSFEDTEKTLVELKDLCHHSLFDQSWCWGFTDCSSPIEFIFSHRIASWFLFSLLSIFAFLCSSSLTPCIFLSFSFFFLKQYYSYYLLKKKKGNRTTVL